MYICLRVRIYTYHVLRVTSYEVPCLYTHVHSTYGIYCIVQVHMYILQYNYYTYMCEVYPCTVYSLYLEVRSTVYHRVKSYTKYKKTYFCWIDAQYGVMRLEALLSAHNLATRGECILSYVCHSSWDGHTCEAAAVIECIPFYGCHSLWESHTC